MAESITRRIGAAHFDQLSERELRALLNALVDAINAVATKLDNNAAAGTGYATAVAAVLTK